MHRQIIWALLVAGIVFFGGVIASERTKADPQYTPVDQLDNQPNQKADDSKDKADSRASDESDALVQLKEINTQLKEIKALLRSGEVRVTVVMNPKEE
jgi:hypothetical protein